MQYLHCRPSGRKTNTKSSFDCHWGDNEHSRTRTRSSEFISSSINIYITPMKRERWNLPFDFLLRFIWILIEFLILLIDWIAFWFWWFVELYASSIAIRFGMRFAVTGSLWNLWFARIFVNCMRQAFQGRCYRRSGCRRRWTRCYRCVKRLSSWRFLWISPLHNRLTWRTMWIRWTPMSCDVNEK